MAKHAIVLEAINPVAEVTFGLILAGGQGRRMGGVDKAQVMLAGRPLIAHVTDRLAPQVARLAISSNRAPDQFAPLLVLPDAPETLGEGPLAGLLAGLDWAAQGGADALVCTPVDTPFLPRDLVARLAGTGVAIARSNGRAHPSVGYWPVSKRPEIAQLFGAGERRLRMAAQGAREVEFSADPDPFANLNTPQDLTDAETALRHIP
ncbi:molybdenum cofactor guanylyltransferase MobA [Thioclava sp.]|uniref:molybdenum cofactor guanylyltransferase MobA n=1 Tax=Thioclava sp. TaxID=1933450 RepID=UPI003AA97A45